MNRYSSLFTISKNVKINCKLNGFRYRNYSQSVDEALRELKSAFPNRSGLYSRIDLVLSKTCTSKIGIIPVNCSRYDVKTLAESLLADPLASNQEWFKAFKNRLLTKDILIKWAPAFDYVGNKNSLIEYPVPFHTISGSNQARENTQILEANSLLDSDEHLRDCHLHIFVTNNLKNVLNSSIETEYPSCLVVDIEQGVDSLDSANTPSLDHPEQLPSTLWVSSKTALQGIDLLIQSPSNASEYLAKMKQSRISEVENIVFSDLSTLNHHLINSIISTCNAIVEPSLKSNADEQARLGTIEITEMRKNWAQDAHRELQTTLSNSLDSLQYSSLAWWKLYYKVDDIYDSVTQSIYRNFLPLSKDRLEYCLGRIDQKESEIYGTSPPSSISVTTEIVDAQNQLATNEAVTLHDTGLKLLTTTIFGIQLPLTIIPLLGVYFYDYSLYSMVSIVILGIIFGFRFLQKGWIRATDQFILSVKEKARSTLSSCESLIWKSYESKVLEQQKLSSHRVALIENIKKAAASS